MTPSATYHPSTALEEHEMTKQCSDKRVPRRKRGVRIPAPAGTADPTASWTSQRWGSAVAEAVYVEMRQTFPDAMSQTDPAFRRAVGQAIEREVARVVEQISAQVLASTTQQNTP